MVVGSLQKTFSVLPIMMWCMLVCVLKHGYAARVLFRVSEGEAAND